MKHKIYSHTVTFSMPINPFKEESAWYYLHCEACQGHGFSITDIANFTLPAPSCKICLGKGIPALPPYELGL